MAKMALVIGLPHLQQLFQFRLHNGPLSLEQPEFPTSHGEDKAKYSMGYLCYCYQIVFRLH
jgi:hypothetical protein